MVRFAALNEKRDRSLSQLPSFAEEAKSLRLSPSLGEF